MMEAQGQRAGEKGAGQTCGMDGEGDAQTLRRDAELSKHAQSQKLRAPPKSFPAGDDARQKERRGILAE